VNQPGALVIGEFVEQTIWRLRMRATADERAMIVQSPEPGKQELCRPTVAGWEETCPLCGHERHARALEAVAKRYSLTTSEVRMLETMLRLNGVKAIAEALGLSQATVKTHLHHVFRKTGTNRQKDLVKLVAGL
jgi:DNA-binding CsgD family transcriptional regulator